MLPHWEMILRLLRGVPPEPAHSLPTYADYAAFAHPLLQAVTSAQPLAPAERAVGGGLLADRLGYAFAAGYQAALMALFGLNAAQVGAFCVSESGGNAPRMIQTRLYMSGAQWRLDGQKTFVTLADEADTLFIVASEGIDEHRRNRLKVVRVPRDAAGLRLIPIPALPFIPEISHGGLMLNQVSLQPTAILPGDGYADYVRPFRTYEDSHVFASVAAYLFRLAYLHDQERSLQERALSLLLTAVAIATTDLRHSAADIALAGLRQQLQALLNQWPWAQLPPDTAQLWERDQPLLRIAEATRQQRLDAAWEAFKR